MGAFKSLAARWQDATGNRTMPTSEELEQFRRAQADFERMMAAAAERDRLDWEEATRPPERWEDTPEPRSVNEDDWRVDR